MPLPRRLRPTAAGENPDRYWRHTLRHGSRGDAVRYVQNRLRQMGYPVFEADGVYGFLTEEAVRALQRDFHLRADGVVGPEVWEILRLPRLPSRCLPHTVKVGETMADIALQYGISITALREANRLLKKSRFRPGLRLFIPSRLVIGILTSASSLEPVHLDREKAAREPTREATPQPEETRVPLAPLSRLILEPLVPDRLGNLVRDPLAPAPKLLRVARPYPAAGGMGMAAALAGIPIWASILLLPGTWLADPFFGSRRWRQNLRAAVRELAHRRGLAGVNVMVGSIPKTVFFQTAVAVNEIFAALRLQGCEAMLTLAAAGDPEPGHARSETLLGRFVRPPGPSGLVALLWKTAAEAQEAFPAILSRVRCWRLAAGPAFFPLPDGVTAAGAAKVSSSAARRLGAEFALIANRFNLAGVVVPVGENVTPAFGEGCREHFHLRHESAAPKATISLPGRGVRDISAFGRAYSVHETTRRGKARS